MNIIAPIFRPPVPDVANIVAQDVRPLVGAIDRDGRYPEAALGALGEAGAYRRHLFAGVGGIAGAVADIAAVGETCLATAYCMWCQDVLALMLDRSENRALTQRVLPAVADGRRLGGAALSNPLKAAAGLEPLALRGERVRGGYDVSGRLPWVSNLGVRHPFAGVFALNDGRKVAGLFGASALGVELEAKNTLSALGGTGTFAVEMNDVFVDDAAVLAEDAGAFLSDIRQGYVLLQIGLALGLARGVAAAIERTGDDAWLPLGADEIYDRADALEEQAARLAARHGDPSQRAYRQVLRARLEAVWLALDAARTGGLQAGAAGFDKDSEIARRQREAAFLGILTPSVKQMTMELARA